jgi:hypothetical protein
MLTVLAPFGNPPTDADALAQVILVDRSAEQVAQTGGFNIVGHDHFTS